MNIKESISLINRIAEKKNQDLMARENIEAVARRNELEGILERAIAKSKERLVQAEKDFENDLKKMVGESKYVNTYRFDEHKGKSINHYINDGYYSDDKLLKKIVDRYAEMREKVTDLASKVEMEILTQSAEKEELLRGFVETINKL